MCGPLVVMDFPSKEEMEARALAPKDITQLYQAAIESVPDGPFKDMLNLGKSQIEEEMKFALDNHSEPC